ncbi:MAG: LOG family protein [Bacteroidota bacterium]
MKLQQQKTVTVFGSSRPQEGGPEYQQAYELGKEIAQAGYILCNGGFGGTMEASARGAKDAGGQTVGVITGVFGKTSANPWIDRVEMKATLIERMMRLVEIGDAYVILKGGTGTLLELAAVWELMNKGLMSEKPIVALGGFWNGVVHTLKEELAWEGKEDCTRFVTLAATPTECVKTIKNKLQVSK